jgi:hypothetical protein
MEFNADGDGLKLTVRWKDVCALLRSIQVLMIAAGALLSAPSIVKLGVLLGWW